MANGTVTLSNDERSVTMTDQDFTEAVDALQDSFLPTSDELADQGKAVMETTQQLIEAASNIRRGGKGGANITLPFTYFSPTAGLLDVDVAVKVSVKPHKMRKR